MGSHSRRRRHAAIRAHMVEQGINYTMAARAIDTAGPVSTGPPDDGFGGHEFEYESSTDLFRCWLCKEYEVTARAAEGPIAPCTGMAGYNGDTERVYLLLTLNPHVDALAFIAGRISATGIGRAPRFSYDVVEGRLLVESAPGVVDELIGKIRQITVPWPGGEVRAVQDVERLTAAEGKQILADNYTTYVATYGVPRG